MRSRNYIGLFVLLMMNTAHAAEVLWLDQFSDPTDPAGKVPAPWQVVQFDEEIPATDYRLIRWDGVNAIEAKAEKSMALLARPVEVDLNATPVMCWRWRVDSPLDKADLATKEGDDYAARVYVSFAMPSDEIGFFLRTQLALARSIYGDAVPDAALNYVWDNKYPVGTRKPNAYTDRTRMIVSQSGAENAGKWVVARQDIQQDVLTEFESEMAKMVQLSVASDTDNTGESAHAGFADFHFVARDTPCQFF